MQEASSNTPSSNRKWIWRIAVPVLALSVTTWMAIAMFQRMDQQLLWGWRPFFLMTSGWIAVLSLIKGFAKTESTHRLLMLSALSGVLLSAGFPPSPLTPLMFIGFVPLLLVEEELRKQYGRVVRWKMFKYAFNAFFIWNICTTWWIINTSFLPGIVASTLNAIFMAIIFVLFHQARSVLPERVHAIALAALWIAFEFLHMFWEISWPWLTLGNALCQYPWAVQWYEFTGVFGGSLWLLLGNYWIYQWYTQERKINKLFWRIAIWIIVPVSWSAYRYLTINMPEETIEVVVVQPNFEPHYQKFDVSQKNQLERFLELSGNTITDSTRYLVFPETSFGFILLNDIENDHRIQELRTLVEEYPSLHIVTGVESYRTFPGRVELKTLREVPDRLGGTMFFDVQNSAIQIAANRPADVYFKSKLVPGAEHFPFRDYLPFIKPLVDMLQGSVAGLTGQKTRDVFRSAVANVAPVICYESVYGEYVGGYVRNGADIIFIVTNDGWWDKTPGHVQHLKIGALRAIEHRRPIARSANTGISCFINVRGDILQATEYGETIAIRSMVGAGEGMTFYTRWGDMIARIAVFLAVLLLALTITNALLKKGQGK